MGWDPMLVFLIALVLCVPFIDHLPLKDEMNHVLAARALLERGTLEMVPDAVPYARAYMYTYLISGMFLILGDSLLVARLPAVFFGALLVTLVFVWVRSEAGRVGAWFAALLLAFSPQWLELSQWARFYTLHALLFFGGCLLFYYAFGARRFTPRTRVVLVVAAVISLLGAKHLQGITLVGGTGLGLWVLLVGVPRIILRLQSRRARWSATGAVILTVAAVGTAMAASGFARDVFAYMHYSDLWAEANRENYRYYHEWFMKQYRLLWVFLPVAGLIALRARRDAALLCLAVFLSAFVIHSIAAAKAERYFFYAFPLWFALWGIALGHSLPWLRQRARSILPEVARPLFPRLWSAAVLLFVVAISLYPAVLRPLFHYTLAELRGGSGTWVGWGSHHRGSPDWVAAGSVLAPLARTADVVIGSHDVATYYAVGRVDYMMMRYTEWIEPMPEFDLASNMIVPVFSNPESLRRVIACHASGIVLIQGTHIPREWTGLSVLVDHLDAHAEPVRLPEEWKMVAYRWDRPGPAPEEAACESLPRSPRGAGG
jgi:hypothetical protein